MSVIIVTGSAGLIGAETSRFFAEQGFDVVGIDNDMRSVFFGPEASTRRNRIELERSIPRYRHYDIDIRDERAVNSLFREYGKAVSLVVHTAAQPSHDWAARDPQTDFGVNAWGTLNCLEATRAHCPESAFIFTSTNKVYGDAPNHLPLVELGQRYEVDESHPYAAAGIDESMSMDQTTHSLFGVSKLAADVMVQEYGRYFDMRTAVFRGGCLTGRGHCGTELHGFLAYLGKCAVSDRLYTIFGYKGKQVRDNIHSADLVEAFWRFFQNPRPAAVYNIGGGREANCSMLEAIGLCEDLAGRPMRLTYSDQNRIGDHIWWVSDTSRFKADFPGWEIRYGIRDIISEIIDAHGPG
jgi:CDP-paratose 2-epimerase